MRGKHSAFPNWALIEFAVANHDENPLIRHVELRAQCKSNADRESMAKRSGRDLQARNPRVGQTLQRRPIRKIAIYLCIADPTQFAHAGILRHYTVALAQY